MVMRVEEGVLMDCIVVSETLQKTGACSHGTSVRAVEEGLEIFFCCCPRILGIVS
jgi:hypothetical protein